MNLRKECRKTTFCGAFFFCPCGIMLYSLKRGCAIAIPKYGRQYNNVQGSHAALGRQPGNTATFSRTPFCSALCCLQQPLQWPRIRVKRCTLTYSATSPSKKVTVMVGPSQAGVQGCGRQSTCASGPAAACHGS